MDSRLWIGKHMRCGVFIKMCHLSNITQSSYCNVTRFIQLASEIAGMVTVITLLSMPVSNKMLGLAT